MASCLECQAVLACFSAQMKAFFDGTGGLVGSLVGQETTHFTALTQLVHHGMVYVPLGDQEGGDGQFDLSEIHAEVCLEARPSPWQCCEEDRGPSSKPQVQSGGDLFPSDLPVPCAQVSLT